MDINIGSVFQKADSDVLFKVVEVDPVRKTAILEAETGESKAQSFTTLKDKRRWLCKSESQASTPVKEEVKPAKPAKAPKKEIAGAGVDIKEFVVGAASGLGAEVSESNGRFISFKVGGKMFAAIFSYSKKSLTLGVRSKAIEDIKEYSTANHMMDARFKFDVLNDDNKDLITNILRSAYDYQINTKKK